MEYRKLITAREIDDFTDALKKNGTTSIALDFEGEFNLHVYGEKLCLIQISDGKEAFLIDPFDADLGAVKRLFEDEKIMKIMWDASSDISLIVNGYSMTIKSVLDLRPAADLLELPKRDYSSVVSEILGIEAKTNKSRFQKYNWITRPIDDEAIVYALGDVLHLHSLKDAILRLIYEGGHLEEYMRQNLIVQNRNYLRVPGQRHKKMKGYKYLSSDEKTRLKSIFNLRDGWARELNWPPHRVIPNPELIDLSKGYINYRGIHFDRNMSGKIKTGILDALSEMS
ncbi:MAG: 3'-5' exonuclease [Spirochaetales bacterium]|nr:3'-5' exonuclease [Spirochaetales bacterium]